MRLARLVLAAAGVLLAGCGETPVAAPPEPPQLRADSETPFGSSTDDAASRAAIRMLDVLEPRFGDLRLDRRSMDARVAPDVVRAHYAARSPATGWTRVAEAENAAGRGTWSFGYASGDRVIALVGLTEAEGGRVPVGIVTNLPELAAAR